VGGFGEYVANFVTCSMFNSNTDLQELELEEVKTLTEKNKHLILYNDDVNTFEFVTETLIQVCRHDVLQAEQCTYLVHFTGKCAVKTAHYDKLRPMCEALLEKGLTAKIE
jgi:ATP-dependent Clp protease adaptor protein ClpS